MDHIWVLSEIVLSIPWLIIISDANTMRVETPALPVVANPWLSLSVPGRGTGLP